MSTPEITQAELAMANSFGMTTEEYVLYRDGGDYDAYETRKAAASRTSVIKDAVKEALAEHQAEAAS
jgi:hypothetical protein